MTDPLLTVNVKALQPDKAHRFWVIELDWEHGTVQTHGEADIYPSYDGRGQFGVESESTGGAYLEDTVISGVQLWIAEQHYLAVFPTEDAMHEGGAQLAAAFGDQMPVGIYGSLA
jgi:hypothetical protein